MEVIVIDKAAWEAICRDMGELAREIAMLHKLYCPETEGKWLDSQEVCLALNISKRTLQYYRATGIIPFSALGGKVYFKAADIRNALETGFKQRKI